jgi:predicted DNA-binding transcriptional regulator AlpA
MNPTGQLTLTAPRPRVLPELMTVKQVAAVLTVTPRTVWRWVAQGALPRPLRLSAGCVRWWGEDVLNFLCRSGLAAASATPPA